MAPAGSLTRSGKELKNTTRRIIKAADGFGLQIKDWE